MNDILSVTLIQPDIIWQNIPENLSKYQAIIDNIEQSSDIIFFPEMFATGFLRDPNIINDREYELVLEWMLKSARKLKSCIAGSHPVKSKGRFYNRFIVAFPDGSIQHYDKRHLFALGGENLHFQPGNKRMVFEWKGWKIMPLICYDLRFPVWSRNTLDYDLLVYSANWPKARNKVWETLLMARAIENQCFVAGVNRVGTDGQSIEYEGRSMIISPKGETMDQLGNSEDLLTVSLNKEELIKFRKEFPVLNDTDRFTLY